RQLRLLEALAPVLLAPDEDRDAVDEPTACLQNLLNIPLGGRLAANRQIVDDDIGAGVLEDLDDISGLAGRLGDDLREIFAQAIVGHAALDLYPGGGNTGELVGVVLSREDRLAQVFAHLFRIDVDRGGEFDVADVIAAKVDV